MDRPTDVDNNCLWRALSRRSFDMGVDRGMNKEHEYEQLLNHISRMCTDYEKSLDPESHHHDPAEGFREIRQEIAWGMYEIDESLGIHFHVPKGGGGEPSPPKGDTI